MIITYGRSNTGWLEDATLSMKQKGLLIVFSITGEISLEELSEHFSDSIEVVKNTVTELVFKGWLACDKSVKQKRNKAEPTQDEIDIVNYLNKKLDLKSPKGFSANNTQTVRLLNAILTNYTKQDVLDVIDLKCRKWMGTEWQMYLRPSTLFNHNKFEGYVNSIDCQGSQVRESIPLQMLE
jgi:uncharacterized phage protein (TIGR02220 family)